MELNKLNELESFLESLQFAMYSGEMTVKHRERTVIYRTLEEMERIEARLEARIQKMRNKTSTRPYTSFTVSVKSRL